MTSPTATTAHLCRTTLPSPVGELVLVASDTGLRAILWPDHATGRVPLPADITPADDHPVLTAAATQLHEWFAGERQDFDLPLDPVGTPFQHGVWAALAQIPYGETVTYAELADALGDRRKARAVGAAVGRNPLSIVVPCHRVVGADGTLTGFAGGLPTKRALLDLESGTTVLPF